MIFTDRKITIRNGKSSINEPVILYRGDYEVSIKFTIMESKFRFKSGVNLVDSEKASHGQLAILAPYGGNVFSEIVKCEDGTVTFTLTKEMIDQLEEVGLYSFQIRLFDYYRESRVSIPPVEFGIEVREPVASEDHDNEVNNAIVGYSIAKVVDGLNEDVPDTFDANGQYNKTNWETGDRITEGKLNKIEDALDKINQNEKNDVAALDKRITNNFNVLNTEIDADIEKVQTQIDNLVLGAVGDGNNPEVIQARGSYSLLNDRLVNIESGKIDMNFTVGSYYISNANNALVPNPNDRRLRTGDIFIPYEVSLLIPQDFLMMAYVKKENIYYRYTGYVYDVLHMEPGTYRFTVKHKDDIVLSNYAHPVIYSSLSLNAISDKLDSVAEKVIEEHINLSHVLELGSTYVSSDGTLMFNTTIDTKRCRTTDDIYIKKGIYYPPQDFLVLSRKVEKSGSSKVLESIEYSSVLDLDDGNYQFSFKHVDNVDLTNYDLSTIRLATTKPIDSELNAIYEELEYNREFILLISDKKPFVFDLEVGSRYISNNNIFNNPDDKRIRSVSPIDITERVKLETIDGYIMVIYKNDDGWFGYSNEISGQSYVDEAILTEGQYHITIKRVDEGAISVNDEEFYITRTSANVSEHQNIYTDMYTKNAKESICNNVNGYDLIIPCITDTHHFPTTELRWGGNTNNKNIEHVDVISDVTKKIPCDCVLHLGDITYDWTTMDNMKQFLSETYESLSNCKCPVYFAFGNHDFGDSYCSVINQLPLSPAQLNGILNPGACKKGYYYVDFEHQKIRLIVLNSSDAYFTSNGKMLYNRSEATGVIRSFGIEQLEWVQHTALNTPDDGWKFIVASHVPPDSDNGVVNADALADMINARCSNGSFEVSDTHSDPNFNFNTSVDFATYKKANVICWIAGHEHNEATRMYKSINVVVMPFIQGDNAGFSMSGGIDQSMTTFDFMCVDTINNKVDFIRYGKNGSNRTISI